MINYYKTLEVREDASQEVIEKAYKALCAKYHPDKHLPNKRNWATKKMQDLNKAYSVLSDLIERDAYDQQRKMHIFQVFWEEGLIGLGKLWINR